jgi:hypothetical protein
MPKNRRESESEEPQVESSASSADTGPAPESATTAEEPAPAPATPTVVMNFDRWFATTGKPQHHKAGMLAFIKGRTSGKRTKESWDELFKSY